MSLRSDAVKRWRSNTKKRIIDSMGGKCAYCSYDKCDAALELHHLDPNEKEIGLGGIRANPIAWTKIVEELRKCVLLCANCHREVHADIITLPAVLPTFNEDFAEYRANAITDGPQTPCPVCEKMKPSTYKTCSASCSSKMKIKIDWDQYDLFDMLTKESYTEVAERIGCSSAAVWKRVKKMRALNN